MFSVAIVKYATRFRSIIPSFRMFSKDFPDHIQPLLNEASQILFSNGSRQIAIEKLSRVASIAQKYYHNHPPTLCNLLAGIALILAKANLIEESRPYLKLCLDHLLSPINTSSQQELNIHINLGNIYSIYYEIDRADFHYTNAIPFFKFKSAVDEAIAFGKICRLKAVKNESAEGVKYCEKAVGLFKAIPGMEKNAAFALEALAKNYLHQEDFEKTISVCFEGLSLTQNSIDEDLKGISGTLYKKLAIAYLKKSEYLTAAENALQASKLLKGLEDNKEILKFLLSIYDDLMNSESRVLMFDEIMEITDAAYGMTEDAFPIYDIIAKDLMNSGYFKNALEVAQKSLKIKKAVNAQSRMLTSYMIIAQASVNLELTDTAGIYIELSENMLKDKINTDLGLELLFIKFRYECLRFNREAAEEIIKLYIKTLDQASKNEAKHLPVYCDFGLFFKYNRKFDEALRMYYKAMSIYHEFENCFQNGKGDLLDRIGEAHSLMGNNPEAIKILFESANIKLALFGENSYELTPTYHLIALTYFNMNEWELAMEYTDMRIRLMELNQDERAVQLANAYILKAEICENLMKEDMSKKYYLVARNYAIKGNDKEAIEEINNRLKSFK
jgi:hypothetical protein